MATPAIILPTRARRAAGAVSAIATLGIGVLLTSTVLSQGAPGVVAIDVLLHVDAATVERAQAVNAQLRKAYPRGYSLDAAHLPHITLVQRFVRGSDLDAVSAAVATVLHSVRLSDLDVTVSKYLTGPWDNLTIVTFEVDVTPELRAFEQKIVDAVQPFAVSGGTADAFAVTAGDVPIGKATIDWVEKFVPASSGENFRAHVTLGVAPQAFVNGLTTKPFQRFTVRPAGIAIYQLGNYGTAQKRLWAPK